MMIDSLLVVLARTALGFFLAAILGMVRYLLAQPIVLSIWDLGYVNFGALGILSLGIGAPVGSFLAWLDMDSTRREHILKLTAVIITALLFAWIGMRQGESIYKYVGVPGIPALRGIIFGAVLGANLPLVALGLFKAFKHPRI